MKKMLVAAALCAGVFAFANVEVAQASDQPTTKVIAISQSTDVYTQELSTKDKKEELSQNTDVDIQELSTKDKKEELSQSTDVDIQELSTKDKKEEL